MRLGGDLKGHHKPTSVTEYVDVCLDTLEKKKKSHSSQLDCLKASRNELIFTNMYVMQSKCGSQRQNEKTRMASYRADFRAPWTIPWEPGSRSPVEKVYEPVRQMAFKPVTWGGDEARGRSSSFCDGGTKLYPTKLEEKAAAELLV